MSTLIHRSPGLTAIYNELQGNSNKRILDLGPMRANNFNFFSQLKCNIHFENLDNFLEEFGNLSTANLIYRLQRFLLSHQGREKFSVILAWDFFNYLPPESLKVVLEILQPWCAEDSFLHVLSYTTRNIPKKPRNFTIRDRYYLEFEEGKLAERKMPPVATSKLLKNTPDYLMEESLVNKQGMQPGIAEYILRYSPGKTNIRKRALAKTEMQERSETTTRLPIHTSPSLALIQESQQKTLLDLGPTNHHNAGWFANRYREVYSENVLSILQTRVQQQMRGDGTEFGLSLFNFDLSLRFDLVFFWDILSFLDAHQMNELLVRLRPFIHSDTLLLAWLYSNTSAPDCARLFKLQTETQLAVGNSGIKSLPFKPHSAIEFTKCLPGMRVKRTFLFQAGMLPGLSEYVLGFSGAQN